MRPRSPFSDIRVMFVFSDIPAVHSPAYLATFVQFPNKRLIAVEKFETTYRRFG